VQTLDNELRRKLEQTGFGLGTSEDEISEVRKMELKRLSSKPKPRKGRF
jgi:hypothetical protein